MTHPHRPDGDGLRSAAAPFAKLGGRWAANEPPAYHDLPDDTIIYQNSGACITAGDVRNLRRWLALPSPSGDSAEEARCHNEGAEFCSVCGLGSPAIDAVYAATPKPAGGLEPDGHAALDRNLSRQPPHSSSEGQS